MSTQLSSDHAFAGSIPELYERLLVPLIFRHYAEDMARRVASYAPERVLEIAAGTGVLTRALAASLPHTTSITATDLNATMLAQAQKLGTARPVRWQAADAAQLPFDDGMFDLAVAQFGVMFFPDKAQAFRAVWRALRPGGRWLFSVWGPIEANVMADCVTRALARCFPSDPPRFLARTPHGHYDTAHLARELSNGGFTTPPAVAVLTAPSRATCAMEVAVAYCEGTPLRGEIEARAPGRLGEITRAVTHELQRELGAGAIDVPMQAIVLDVVR